MKYCALVTARMSSTRMPGKSLQVIADGLSLIQVVIRRAKRVGCPVVLATTEDPSDNPLVEIAEREGIECFRGAVKNKIKRWANCFAKHEITEGLLVDGDDPTFDFNVGRRALKQLQSNQSDMVLFSPEMTPGFFTYGITRAGIEKLLLQAPDPKSDTDVITTFVKRAGLTQAVVPALPDETEGHHVRLTVDYPEDVQFYRELYQRVSYLAPGPEVVRTAIKHHLQTINWHKHEAFLENQRTFNERVNANG